MTNSRVLWQQLQEANLVTGTMPTQEYNDQPPAFFMRLLLGASGWLSALFFCGFLSIFLVSFLAQTSNLWGLGVVLCGLSIWLSRTDKISFFLEQFVFACSIAGQGFIAFGVLESSHNMQVTAAVLFVLEIFLFITIGIHSQRATAIFLACIALLCLLGEHAWLYALPILSAASAWLWFNQLRFYSHRSYLQPASVGLTLGLWVTIGVALLANSTEFSWWQIAQSNWHTQLWTAAALTSVVCFGLAWQLIQRRVQQPQLRYIALLLSIGIALVNLAMLGLAPLCLLLCIGIALTHKRLIWLNLLALTGYLMLYYYSLNNTLLYKSILLCASGAVLLVLYVLLNRYATRLSTESNDHA